MYNLCQDSFREALHYTKIPIESIEQREDDTEEALDFEEAKRIYGLLANIPAKDSEVIRMKVIDCL